MKEGWVKKKLGEVCEINMGQSPDSKFYNSNNEGYPFYQGKKDFGKTKLNLPRVWTTVPTKISKINDILMSVRAPVGSINYNLIGDICIGRGLASITVHEILHKDYLFYYLLSMQNQIEGKEGVGFSSINKKGISDIEINIPSHKEQCLIVEKLDAGFAKIDQIKANAKKNLQQAKDLFQSTAKEELAYQDGWMVESLHKLTTQLFAGGDVPRLEFSKERTDIYKVPIYANAVENDGLYGYTSTARVNVPSITIAARGSGTGHVLKRDVPFYPIVRLICVVSKKETITRDYLFFYLKQLIIKTSGSAIPQLTIPMMKNYMISYPPSLTKQQKIVDKLDKLSDICKKLEDNYNRILTECDALKQALLRKAFNGEL